MKYLKIVFIFLSSFLIYKNVYAQTNLVIENVKVTEKSASMVVNDISFEDTTITSKMEFHNLNDFVTYEVEVRNPSEKTYTLAKIINHLNSELITVESNDIGLSLDKGEKKTIHLKVKYVQELINQEFISPNDSSLTLNFVDTTVVTNPFTLDIFYTVFIACILILVIIGGILYYKKLQKMVVVFILFMIPLYVFAQEMVNINFNFSNVKVFGRFLSYHIQLDDGSGNINDYTKTYGDTVGDLPVPEKEGYTFEGWVDQNDRSVTNETVVEEDLNLTATYELIHYTITYDLGEGELSLPNPTSYTVEDEFTLYNPTLEGYTFLGWGESNSSILRTSLTIYRGTTGNKTFKAFYSSNSDTVYTVIHKQMNLEGVYEETERETLHGATDSTVSPQPKEYTGFITPESKSITISGDGSSVVTYLYERKQFTFQVTDRDMIESGTEDGTYYYGTRVNVVAKVKLGYSMRWSDGSELYSRSFILEENTTLTATYTPLDNTPYTVVHKQMNLDGETYSVYDQETFYGTTDTTVTPLPNDYEGFTSPDAEEITITGDGEARVTYLYTRNKYLLTIDNSNLVETTTPSGEYYYGTSITLTAKDSSREFIKWSNEETEKTITFLLTENTTIYPIYSEEIYDFPYTGEEQTFIVPETGYYLIEVWGAQGGSITGYYGGYGGYSTGSLYLTKNDTLYINVGGEGIGATVASQRLQGGYNGGGDVRGGSYVNHINASGGGATHIALSTGTIETFENKQQDLLIVAGGGGGARDQPNHITAARWGHGGAGGGAYSSGAYSTNGTYTVSQQNTCIATQSSGSAFGMPIIANENSGGGGGYYAGYNGETTITSVCDYLGTGSGGSGYIGNTNLTKKHMVCFNCNPSYVESEFSISSICHSKNPISDCSKEGAGYTRITYIGTINNQESSITLKNNITMKAGTTDYLLNTIHIQEGMSFTSSDEAIATINSSGLITAIKQGTTNITLSYQNKTIIYELIVMYDDGTPYYFDVTNGTTCSETNYNDNSDKLGKTGCLKFYIFDDDGRSNLKLLLNHNTTGTIAWNLTGSTTNGPSLEDGQMLKQLQLDTASWKGTKQPDDYVDSLKNYTVSYNNYKARILTYDELNRIGGLIPSANAGNKAWIFDNYQGYWTISAYDNTVAWAVDGAGNFDDNYVYHTIYFGIRPVIEIERP